MTVPVTPAPLGGPVSFTRIALADGTHEGTALRDGRVVLGPAPGKSAFVDAPTGRTVDDERAAWISATVTAPFAFDELIASWNAATPAGTWVTIDARAVAGVRVTKWYALATWAADGATVRRTTVRAQDDADGRVDVDTLVRATSAQPFTGYQLRVTLHRLAGSGATPEVSFLGAVVSTRSERVIPSAFGGAARDLDVPALSQEIHTGHFSEYAGGGEAWCSPTSTAMILGFWKAGPTAADLAAFPGAGHVDAAVDHAARDTFDAAYRGTGNWPMNTAYAGRYGLVGFVTRLRSLAEAERFITAGIPLIASISGELPGFLFGRTNGHLLVIRGFTPEGAVIANDPAVRTDAEARKVYARADFERVWLNGSGGTVYVIRPAGVALPAPIAGVAPNW